MDMCSASYIDHTLQCQVYGRRFPLLDVFFGLAPLTWGMRGRQSGLRKNREAWLTHRHRRRSTLLHQTLAEVVVVVGIEGEHADRRTAAFVPDGEAVITLQQARVVAVAPCVLLDVAVADHRPKAGHTIPFRVDAGSRGAGSVLTRRTGRVLLCLRNASAAPVPAGPLPMTMSLVRSSGPDTRRATGVSD
jgi:hypothetical protein